MKLGNHISCKKISGGKNTYQQGTLCTILWYYQHYKGKDKKWPKIDPRIISSTKHANIYWYYISYSKLWKKDSLLMLLPTKRTPNKSTLSNHLWCSRPLKYILLLITACILSRYMKIKFLMKINQRITLYLLHM